MTKNPKSKESPTERKYFFIGAATLLLALLSLTLIYTVSTANLFPLEARITKEATDPPAFPPPPVLDIAAYNAKLFAIANEGTSTGTSTASSTLNKLWPVHTVYPNGGAVLPFNRIVAYYGNFYSTQMGVLGQYPTSQVLQMLQNEVTAWQQADPTTPVIPAIDYIAVTAQGSPGPDGKYRLRMPASQIEKAISLANQVHGLVFLDIQVGQSNLQSEIPLLQPYLKLPQVELAIDPEFAMKKGEVPDTVIGTFSSSDINYAAGYLASVVEANNLPPKILVVHRFTQDMVTNYREIQPLPQVQIVMDMDGWGSQAKKRTTYRDVIYAEPVQFTGFKVFYQNDMRPPSTGLLTPKQILALTPQPIFIQYQ